MKSKNISSNIRIVTLWSSLMFSLLPVVQAEETFLLPREVTAGAVYNQQMQNAPPAATVSPDNVEINKPAEKPFTEGGSSKRVLVRKFSLSGDQLLSPKEAARILGGYENKEVTLAEIKKLTAEITEYLRAKDYALANAFLPVQDIKDGVVRIEIVGGRYGKVTIENKAGIDSAVIAMEAACIKPGSYIKLSEVERVALLLSDLSGVSAKAALSPTGQTGVADFTLQISDNSQKVSYSVSADNYGGYYTGADEGGVSVGWSNVSGKGDRASLRLSTSGSGLWLGAIAYNIPVGRAGGNMGISYSSVNYTLGKGYEALGANGIANVAALTYSLPLKRGRQSNFYFTANLTNALLNDNNNLGSQNQAKTVNRFILGFNGDSTDNWNGGGSNVYSFTWTNGDASMDSGYSKLLDTALGTAGAYSKINYAANRTQKLADRLSLWLNVSGQWTNDNLVSFEDMSLGGPYAVRAYPTGEGSGDNGVLGNAEIRWLLPMHKNFPGVLQLSAFYDYGNVTVNTQPTINNGANNITLAGYGVGLTWMNTGKCSAALSYAWKDGVHTNNAAPDKAGQFWFSINIML